MAKKSDSIMKPKHENQNPPADDIGLGEDTAPSGTTGPEPTPAPEPKEAPKSAAQLAKEQANNDWLKMATIFSAQYLKYGSTPATDELTKKHIEESKCFEAKCRAQIK